MKLFVDMGNSCIKWSLVASSNHLDINIADSSQVLQLTQWQQAISHNLWLTDAVKGEFYVIDEVFVSSVSRHANLDLLQHYIKQNFSLHCQLFQTEAKWQTLTNAYDNPQQMGVDRWMGMIAAWHKFHQACMVIDCGTAITIDAINVTGQHLGGHIVPGLNLLQKTLATSTASVTLDHQTLDEDDGKKDDTNRQFGHSTEQAVGLGCRFMVTDYLYNRWQQFHKLHHHGLLLITGGDGLTLSRALAWENVYDKELVLQGLQIRQNNG